jgi:hypothetical protein
MQRETKSATMVVMKKVKSSVEHIEGFKCSRRADGVVIVTNSLNYVMGEYYDSTGITKWHRVVLATNREKMEAWLIEKYPVRKVA